MTEISQLQDAIALIVKQLSVPELTGKDFEDFPKQEQALKVSGYIVVHIVCKVV